MSVDQYRLPSLKDKFKQQAAEEEAAKKAMKPEKVSNTKVGKIKTKKKK